MPPAVLETTRRRHRYPTTVLDEHDVTPDEAECNAEFVRSRPHSSKKDRNRSRSSSSSSSKHVSSSTSTSSPSSSKKDRRKKDRQTRRVRFHKKVYVKNIACLDDMDAAVVDNMYFTDEEHTEFKSGAKKTARAVERKDRDDESPNTYSRVLDRIYSECSKPLEEAAFAEDDKRALEHWVALGHCRRGLERWAVPSHDKERKIRRDVSIKSVIDVQDKVVNGQSVRDQPELIAKLYSSLTEPSRVFARIMGEADAAAVTKEETYFSQSDKVVSKDAIVCELGKKRVYVKSSSRMAVPTRDLRRAGSCRKLVTQASQRHLTRTNSSRSLLSSASDHSTHTKSAKKMNRRERLQKS